MAQVHPSPATEGDSDEASEGSASNQPVHTDAGPTNWYVIVVCKYWLQWCLLQVYCGHFVCCGTCSFIVANCPAGCFREFLKTLEFDVLHLV